VADAVEAARQDVEQDAAQELGGGERHGLVTRPALGAVVLVAEGDAVVVVSTITVFGGDSACGDRVW